MNNRFYFKTLTGLLFLTCTLLVNKVNAQLTNTGIFFQAVARDVYSNPAKDRKIYVQSTIVQGSETGVKVFIEDHQSNTDATGVFGISIGKGTRKGGTVANLTSVEWAKGPYFLNLKIAISPIAPAADWDYTKEWVDLGTTPFGTVPYALYSGSSGALDDKLSIADTAKMLAIYAKAQTVQSLSTAVAQKISTTDTAAMLAPYKAVVNAIVSSNITSLTAAAVNAALDSKVNVADSITKYVTPTQLAAKTFDSTAIYNQLGLKANSSDVNTSLSNKENTSNKTIDVSADGTSDIKYPSAKAVKSYVDTQVSGATIADANATTKGKIQLAGDLAGTAASPIIANNAITTTKLNDASVTDAKIATVSGSKVTGNITGNAANITGNLAIVNGGTGATSASGARTNLGLAIGTDVQAPLSFTTPLSKNGNTVSINQATTSVDGYLSAADFTNFNNKIDATQKAANNGVATLGNDGKIPSNQIPAISFQSANVVSSLSSMLAISGAQVGSIAIRTDENKNYVLSALPASTSSNWIQLATPTSVTSVNGSAGPNVVLTTNDVAEGTSNKYFTDARVRSAISASAPLSFNSSTGTISMTAASGSTNGYLSSTDFTTFSNKQNAIAAGVDYLAPNGSAANLTNFPTLNQNTTGNAATATRLATSRNINGVAFDGSANITIAADANTLTGTTLASTVTGSNLTSVGTVTTGVWSGTTIAVAKGGTGATTASAALTNLGAEPTVNKSTATDLGSTNPSDVLFPSQKAVKTYIDLQNANAGVADGSITNAKLAGSITANKLLGTDITTVGTITTGTWSGSTIAINKGGTGATTAAGARTNLGLVIGTDVMAANATTTLTGDVTGTGSGTFTTTLANSGVTANTYGSSTAIPVLTVDAKGRVTNASTVGIIAGVNTLTYTSGTTYASGGTISGTTLTLAAADGTNPGLISTGAQTIAGAKTFSSNVTAPNFIGDLNGNANSANSVNNAITFNNGGAGAISGATFNGNAAKTISYNTIGAAPAAGSSNITTLGTITSGTWNASTIPVGFGGTGVTSITGLIKGSGSTPFTAATAGVDYQAPLTAGSGIAISGGGIISASGITSSQIASNANILPSQIYDSKVTIGTTDVSLGGSATTLGGLSTVTANTFVGTLSGTASNANALTGSTLSNNIVNSSLTSVGTITSGIWSATALDIAHGGTSLTSVGTNGQVLKSNGTTMTWADPSGVQSFNGLSTSNQTISTSTTGNTFTITSSSGNHVINIPIASLAGVSNGLISNTEFNAFQNKQNAYTNLTSIGALTNAGGFLKNDGNGSFSYTNPNKTDVGLGAVDNISIGTWTGSTNITTLGTINTGTWAGSVIADNKITTNLTGKTYNGLTLNSVANGFTVAGGTSSKTLTVASDANVSGTNTGDQTITLTGDVTGTGTGTFTSTLANSGVTANTYGSSTAIPVLTVDAKGRVTSASTVGIIAGVNTLTYTSGTTYANGGIVSGTTLTLAAADGNNPGLISTGAQTIAGAKTFSSNVTASTFVGNLSGTANTATNIAGGISGSIPYQTAAGTTAMIPNGQANQILTATGSGTYTWTSVSNVTGNSVPYTGATGAVNLGAYDLTVNGLTVGTGVNGSTLSNTAFGYNALAGNNSGSGKNTGIGYAALNKNTSGQLNTAVGYNALLNVLTTVGSTAIGAQTLEKNIATGNTAVGTTAGYFLDNLAFQNNSFLGYGSGGRARGAYNIGIGYLALEMRNSGSSLTGADRNIAIGNSTMSLATRPVSNVVIGDNAGPAITFGSWNTILGQQSGKDITEGYHNTFIGDSTGLGITTGSNNLIVGSKVSGLSATLTGNIILADGAGNIRAQHDGTNGWNLGTITSGTWSGTAIAIANGGTGSNTVAGARTNLGLGSLATKSTITNAEVASGAAIDFAKLNITKVDITGLGVQDALTAGSGISISSGTISATGLTTSNLASNAAITNSQLANSTTTLGSTTMTLGGTVTSVTGLTSLNTTNLTATNITGTLSGTATGLATGRTITTTGDVTYTSGAFDGTANVTGTATLTNTTVTNGSYGSSTAIPTFTVDSKGRLTAASTASIIADAGTLTGTTLNSTVTSSSLTGVGTITSGVWSGTTISIAKGGTGATSKTAAFDALSPMTTTGDIIYGATSGTGTRLGVGATGQVLTVSGGAPTWATPTGVTSIGAISGTATSTGATITSGVLNLTPADNSNGGVVTTGNQTFAGAKTFNSNLTVNSYRIGRGAANIYGTIALGPATLNNASATGFDNIAIGNNSLNALTTAGNNIGIGKNTMQNLTSAGSNIAIGSTALATATDGSQNVAIGNQALTASTTGGSNTAVGSSAGVRLTTGSSNVIIGESSAIYLTTGSGNVIIGNGSGGGSSILTGDNSVFIGRNTRPQGDGQSNQIVIAGYSGSGPGQDGLGSNTTTIGNSATTDAQIFGKLSLPNSTASTSTTSGALIVSGGTGIAGNANIGGTLGVTGATTLTGAATISNTTTSSSSTSGALRVLGGAGIAENLNVGGTLGVTGATTLTGATTISNTATSNSTTSGALVVRGGVGVAGNLTVGGTIEIDGGSPGAGKVLSSDANGVGSWTYAVGSTILTSTSNYAITLAEAYVFYNGSTNGAFTIPAAAASNAGKTIVIKNKTAFGITITALSSGTFYIDSANGSAASVSVGIEASNNWVKLVSDGSQWNVFRALF